MTSRPELRHTAPLPRFDILSAILLPLLLLTGCTQSLELQIQAGSCLNPTRVPCKDAAFDSRPVEVRFYPLSACPAAGSLKWADMLEPEQAEQLLGKLRLGHDQTLSIERTERRSVTFNPLPKNTKCLVAVVVGRGEGEQSVISIPITARNSTSTFSLEVYDLLAPKAATPSK